LGHDPGLILRRPGPASPSPSEHLDPAHRTRLRHGIITWHRHGIKPAHLKGSQHPGFRQPALCGLGAALTMNPSYRMKLLAGKHCPHYPAQEHGDPLFDIRAPRVSTGATVQAPPKARQTWLGMLWSLVRGRR